MGYIKPPTDEQYEAFFENQTQKMCNKLEQSAIAAIEKCLAKGDRAEVVPVKDGVKVLQIHRKTVCAPKENRPG